MIYRGGSRQNDLNPLLPDHELDSSDKIKRFFSNQTLNILGITTIILIGLTFYIVSNFSPTIAELKEMSNWVDPESLPNDPELPNLPKVTVETYFDIEIDGEYVGRVVFGLFGDTVPKTSENFKKICSGEMGEKLHYKNMKFHRIIPGFIVQGGDITNGDGTGSESIYGSKFDDEPAGLELNHDRPYLLQMANSGRNTNGSQFCIMLGAAPHLNGHHVVFGRVLSGFEVVDKMGLAGGPDERPTKKVQVVDSGMVHPSEIDD